MIIKYFVTNLNKPSIRVRVRVRKIQPPLKKKTKTIKKVERDTFEWLLHNLQNLK